MADELRLSGDFPAADETSWRALTEKALEGAPFESLESRTEHGLVVRPLYNEAAWPSRADASGLPGQQPFVRGGQAQRDAFLPWDIRQIVAHPDPAEANRQALELLNGGVSSLELRIDPEGEHGVAVRDAADLAEVLASVRLDLAPVAIETAGAASGCDIEVAALLAAVAGRAPDADRLALAFNIDPVSVLARTGGLPHASALALTEAAVAARRLADRFASATTLRADARCVHEAGGTEIQELAFLAASGAEYMRSLVRAGASADEAARSILCTLAVGADYFVSMAKLRAARRLWGRVAGAFGASAAAAAPRIQCVSSRRMLARRDPWVNMLRNTAACFAAGVGGADIVTLRCFTDAIGRPGPLARRLARNTQVIAQEECGLGRVIDPPGGAWAIEKLADEMAQAAWAMFQLIESEGGLMRALEAGGFQAGVMEARARRERAVAFREELVTGVTDFPDLTQADAPIDDAPVTIRPERSSGVRALSRSLDDLLAAAEAGATLAELSGPPTHGAEAEALWPVRLAEPFERLRDAADARRTAGQPLRIALAALGPLAEHSPRLTFAENFFAAGGVETVSFSGDVATIAEAVRASGLRVACICGADRRYATDGETAARALKATGAHRVYVAGKPGETAGLMVAAGVDEFIHIGVNVLDSLAHAHAELSLPGNN